MDKDRYEKVLDGLSNIVIDSGITSYLMARNYEPTLNATNFLKKDKNYYDIIGFQWANIRPRVSTILKPCFE